MTKVRNPLTFEKSLAKIASLIGWDRVAKIAKRGERTVHAWSENEIKACVNIKAALALDLAYQKAGGDGAPILQCYALRIQADGIAARASTDELAAKTMVAIKEAGEAHAALVAACRPGATEFERRSALKEVVEASEALTNTLAILRAGWGSDVDTGGISS